MKKSLTVYRNSQSEACVKQIILRAHTTPYYLQHYIVIRAWLITHAHNDHYECFTTFADKYADAVTLEYFMYCPAPPETRRSGWGGILTWGEIYNYINKFEGTKVLTVHTGMEFTYGDVKIEILFAPDDMLIDFTTFDQNEMSIVSRVYTDTTSALLLADTGKDCAFIFKPYYGSYLKSDICQTAHHGVETFPLYMYEIIRAPIMFYPCDAELYNAQERFYDVRMAIKNSDYIKKILHHEEGDSTFLLSGSTPGDTDYQYCDAHDCWYVGNASGVVVTDPTCTAGALRQPAASAARPIPIPILMMSLSHPV